jgi:hypothetical protein
MKKKVRTIPADAVEKVRGSVRKFRDDRVAKTEEDERLKSLQPLLVAELREVGVTNEIGVVVDPTDKNKGVAYVQQNKGSLVWNQEAILDWLDKNVAGRKILKKKCQSTVFDISKFEALVASKEIPPKVAAKFQTQMPDAAPFIRFGKKEENSL